MYTVKFKLVGSALTAEERAILSPKQKSAWASGFDLASAHKEELTLHPGERLLISTGIAIALEPGLEGQVRSRSGLSLKNGVVVLNSPGTIDADYRGEIKVILANMSKEPFVIHFGMRIAQLVIAQVVMPEMVLVASLDESERGDAGFGSTRSFGLARGLSMIPRYQTAVMNHIFSDDFKFQTWFRVEVAYLEAYLEHTNEPDPELIDRLNKKLCELDWLNFSAKVDGYEREVRHDVIAFLHALEDELGADARLIHLGLTSSDIVDTAFALLLKMASEEISHKLELLISTIFKKAKNYRGVICIGRTHGQAAEPTTFGIKLLTHLCEFLRAHERIEQATKGISVGKFSGAVGVYAHTNPEVEEKALASLGLSPETVATQIVARDRHATLFVSLATLAGSIERLATEIRLLMHGQVKEVFEPFSAKQKGSSAMPHKKNPILSENLTGLMRLMRSYALAALENQALWHERDISHSSVERVIAPDAFSVMDFALTRLTGLMANLTIDEEEMAANIDTAGDVLRSQAIMLALVKKGLLRQEAYELVQKAAINGNGHSFLDNLREAGILAHMDEHELAEIFSGKLEVLQEAFLFRRVERLIGKSASIPL